MVACPDPVYTGGCLIADPENGAFLSDEKIRPTFVDLGFERFRSLRFKKGFFLGPIFVRILRQG